MRKGAKTFTFILIAALFCLTLIFTPNASVKGQTIQGTIVINANGTINPNSGSVPIQKVGSTYFLTRDIYGSIIVECSNIVIDGNGFSVNLETSTLANPFDWNWTGSTGFNLHQINNVTITNTNIRNFHDIPYDYMGFKGIGFEGYAIYLDNTSDININGNTIMSSGVGIKSERSSNNNIYYNTITNNSGIEGTGIVLDSSNYNRIYNNSIDSNEYGIVISNSHDNTVYWNNIGNNTGNRVWPGVGIRVMIDAKHNSFYLNNLIGNSQNGLVLGTAANSWDNGRFGNYWSDYQTKYPKASSGENGVADTPYGVAIDNIDRAHAIPNYNIDHYPLTEPVDINTPQAPVSVPEFSGLTILPLLAVALLFAVIISCRKPSQ